ncbi:hypothetical protein CGCSCA4_v011198 [Colletotrichum siamense]|uniref:Uncharacterized protein n=1 Tax=Colletotrichum siamense TaxID=690259 RepID=A0A9P5ELX6_COLSI|nr:uncharacterized protein CGCS363_v010757 [Colletotrichum siamense]KAF4839484.1 hypothetical protein CGCSCA4_v011198 [Colletotrichum siamense]KAF4853271.1 hypothetical protein CGCSCA2_v009985 [Colletotrichum siamense]KAF5492392.1 hypothetical protein CGCS363_v010757 [Colletotrichum siamense]
MQAAGKQAHKQTTSTPALSSSPSLRPIRRPSCSGKDSSPIPQVGAYVLRELLLTRSISKPEIDDTP